eukprot:CAMPEP_0115079780 /NCGR_PEP_ID=MMETSP0227-20121206/18300_1 /TAXON_ID=89957 /ORGANISM="Polarella glacialis, Strain CCMP 1383" /LENGTH=527 /DNA_ID=CAMNT_0002467325 /DNA_START=99 /DNA_END=1682 /DNA_ORIENTATION=-
MGCGGSISSGMQTQRKALIDVEAPKASMGTNDKVYGSARVAFEDDSCTAADFVDPTVSIPGSTALGAHGAPSSLIHKQFGVLENSGFRSALTRRILPSLNRGWMTPDGSWELKGPMTGQEPSRPEGRRLKSLNRGWSTPDPSLLAGAVDLEAVAQALNSIPERSLEPLAENLECALLPDLPAQPDCALPRDALYGWKCARPLDEQQEDASREDCPLPFDRRDTGTPDRQSHSTLNDRLLAEEVLDSNHLDTSSQAFSLGFTAKATSSASWHNPVQSIIFLDWDDTILPTSWLQQRPSFKMWQKLADQEKCPEMSVEDRQELTALDKVARSVLLSAASLGRVVCVTLARNPWQQETMKALLPRLTRVWNELNIQVVYASEEKVVQRGNSMRTPLDSAETQRLQRQIMAKKKQQAMERCLKNFYGERSWKNVLSIGDGDAEADAMQEIGFSHQNPTSIVSGSQKPFRVKNVQMLKGPSCLDVSTQLQVLQSWLPGLVNLDDDMTISMYSSEDKLWEQHQRLVDALEQTH